METSLKKIRKKEGLMQIQIAEKANISVRAYQNYEANKRVPDAYTAQIIAETLNTTVEEIFPLPQQNNTIKKQ